MKNNDNYKNPAMEAWEGNPGDAGLRRMAAQSILSDENFNGMLQSWASDLQRNLSKEPTESIVSTAVVIGMKEGHRGFEPRIAELVSDDEDRVELFASLGRMAYEKEPDFLPAAILFQSEVWASAMTAEELEFEGGYRTPSEDPKRKEQICIMGQTMDGRLGAITFDITRREDNTIKLHEPSEHLYDGSDDSESPTLSGFFQGWMEAFKPDPSKMPEDLRQIRTRMDELTGKAENIKSLTREERLQLCNDAIAVGEALRESLSDPKDKARLTAKLAELRNDRDRI